MPSVVVQAGNVGSGAATVKVYAADGTTLATVYKDPNGGETGPNPLPKKKALGYFGMDNAGNYTVYLVPGDYQLGVTPAGGSETKTPFTVVAPVVEVQTVFTEVFGIPADGDLPTWNDTTKRFEWAAPTAASLPSQAGFSGQFLTTDGSNSSWGPAPRPARPDGVDQSFRLVASGTGATATRIVFGGTNPRGLYGYRFYTPNANTVAYAKSGPLGYFDLNFAWSLPSQTGATGVFAVVPNYAVTPASPLAPVIIELQFNYGSSQTFTVYATNAAGTRASAGTLSQVTSAVTNIRLRRDAIGYLVQFTQANGTVTNVSTRSHSDLSDNYEGTVTLCLGKLENGAGVGEFQMLINSFVRSPVDALHPSGALNTILAGPLRGCNEFHDGLLHSEINRTTVQRRTGSGSLANDWIIAGAVAYANTGSFADWAYYSGPFIRDLGDTNFARGMLNNHLANVGTGGVVPKIVGTTGEYIPGTGRHWSYPVIAQTAAMLSHDGDCSWFTYATLTGHIAWWEANRKTARGLFLMDNGQEGGWDGAISTNPLGDPAITPNRFESVIMSCFMYLEYQAMQGIANQLGHAADAATYAASAAALKTAIQTNLWSNTGGWLFNYDTSLSALSPHYQADAIYGLWAGVLTQAQAQVVRDRLMDPAHFLCAYGITSLDKTDAGYLTGGYSAPGAWQTNWNGPVWEPPIYLASFGLARYGFVADGFEVARRGANLYRANLTNADAFGFIGEWHNPDTGAADTLSHKPFFGWGLLALRAYLDLARNYDPYLMQTTGTTRSVEPYTRPIA